MAKRVSSWFQYLDKSRINYPFKTPFGYEGLEKYIDINSLSSAMFGHVVPWIYLLDYTTGEYKVISDSITQMLGYRQDDFLKNGLCILLESYDPQHLAVFNQKIFPDRLKILKSIPPEEHADYIFSLNFKCRNKAGHVLDVVQRNSFIRSDSNCNPLLSFGNISNVTHFKNENSIIQVVEKINRAGEGNGAHEIISRKAYYLNDEDQLFTRREKELLPYLTDGLCSKEIANKLFISEFTVINHRRHMMEKSGSKNMIQLVSFAMLNGLL